MKIVSTKKYNKIIAYNKKCEERNQKLKEYLESVHTDYIGISADTAIDKAIELFKSFGLYDNGQITPEF